MKIAMYDLEGYLLEVFEVETVFELEKELKATKISACINSRQLTTINRQFRICHPKTRIPIKIGDVSSLIAGQSVRSVNKYYKGKFICSYDNASLASKKNNIGVSSINDCCNGRYKSAGGFYWEHAKDIYEKD